MNPLAKPFVPTTSVDVEVPVSIPISVPRVELHPCVNCEKPCKGKQCKECHLKMMNSNCLDCGVSFFARRKDGTMRKRCKDCQVNYESTYIQTCPVCNNGFHSVSKDGGRPYEMCLSCYKEEKEKEKTERAVKTAKWEADRAEREKEKKCSNKHCEKLTRFKLCSGCFDRRKTEEAYMIFTCSGCGYRGRGNYKTCRDCSAGSRPRATV